MDRLSENTGLLFSTIFSKHEFLRFRRAIGTTFIGNILSYKKKKFDDDD